MRGRARVIPGGKREVAEEKERKREREKEREKGVVDG
jgi:hypothetical protein